MATLAAGRVDQNTVKPVGYKNFAGLKIAIEHPKGSIRHLKDDNGKTVYKVRMQHHYGYFEKTKGRDGDEVDCFIGPKKHCTEIFIIHMLDKGPDIAQREDEDKVFVGFSSEAAAKKAFLLHYPPEFYGGMTGLPVEEFVRKLAQASKPYRKKKITASFKNWNKAVKKAKCPDCDSKIFSLMPTDFETAKCKQCGKAFDIMAEIEKPGQDFIAGWLDAAKDIAVAKVRELFAGGPGSGRKPEMFKWADPSQPRRDL